MSRPTRNTQNSKKSADFSKRQNTQKSRPKRDNGSDMDRPKPSGKPQGRPQNKSGRKPTDTRGWIWGQHAVLAALANPQRKFKELRISPRAKERANLDTLDHIEDLQVTEVHPSELDKFLPEGASHQGFALLASEPKDSDIASLTAPCEGTILVLDQVTDPHNVGAMFRLGSAFNLRGIIMQDRNAPPIAGATAKVAVGAIETVPYALVTNIANTLLDLKERGWMVTGLAGDASLNLTQAFALPKNATVKANVIVMGAEGPGLRPRVRDCCDQLAKIHMPGGAESLNVSTAAAIAIYEAARTIS